MENSSSMIQLQNEHLQVLIKSRGAELCSLKHKQSGTEYIWQAQPDIWGKHSPILFPIVGTLKNGTYSYQGQTYAMGRHGFARDMDFACIENNEHQVIFQLVANDETLKCYPFLFELRVVYTLQNNTVDVRYEVQNSGMQTMYFSIGAHPAFNIPLEKEADFESYSVQIDVLDSQTLPILLYPLNEHGLLRAAESTPYFETVRNIMPLKRDLFQQDALVFKGINAAVISIIDEQQQCRLQVQYDNFPYLGLWNKYGADFMCIEPWCGITDAEDTHGCLTAKEGMMKLEPQNKWTAAWEIAIPN